MAEDLVIWKFPLPDVYASSAPQFAIEMPVGAYIVKFGIQAGRPTLWAACRASRPVEQRQFRVVGTGDPYPWSWFHVGTWEEVPFVWHLLELPSHG